MGKRNSCFLLIPLLLVLLTACDPNRYFEQNKDIAGNIWQLDDVKQFEVNVDDIAQHYNIYVNLRHSNAYEWRNTWVKVSTILPDSSVISNRVNLPLAEADGRWYGECLGDICDIAVPIQINTIFPQTGTYIFTIQHDMRDDQLPYVMSTGLRIEKYTGQ